MEPVVVWINSAFGVGKTSVAKALVREWDGAVLFDPERIGRLLRRTIPRERHTDDYQDFPLWRRLTVETISGLATGYCRPVVVPMTLTNDSYFQEIIGGLRDSGVEVFHFALTARPRNHQATAVGEAAAGAADPVGLGPRRALLRGVGSTGVPRADQHGQPVRARSRGADPRKRGRSAGCDTG